LVAPPVAAAELRAAEVLEMGGETSKEVRLAASPEASAEVANQAVRSAAEYEKHVAHLKEM
jgi:hypothetical protein